jgi:2-isopropylmalate synthase
MSPEKIGLKDNRMVLGKHSGRHAFLDRVKSLGYDLTEDELNKAFENFIILADKKKEVYTRDIEALLQRETVKVEEVYKLISFMMHSGNTIPSTATITLKNGKGDVTMASVGDGPVDAAFKAIEKIVSKEFILDDFRLNSVTEGEDALGEATVKLVYQNKMYKGKGLSTDIVESSIKAYLEAVNRALTDRTTIREEI